MVQRSQALFAVVLSVALCCACTAKKTGSVARSSTAKVDVSGSVKPVTAKAAGDPVVPAAQAPPKSDPPSGEDLPALMAKAEQTLRVLADRTLDAGQTEQRETGAAFLDQARTASNAGDSARAAVLVNKCLLLLEDLEGQTR